MMRVHFDAGCARSAETIAWPVMPLEPVMRAVYGAGIFEEC